MLAQAAQTQENALSGHLGDLSHGLEELQQRLYEGTSRQTLDEIVPYPVTFDALASSSPGGAHSDAIFVDCDGRAANELLNKRRSLGAEVGDGAPAREILASDTILLVIDASAAATEMETTFELFSQFLRSSSTAGAGEATSLACPCSSFSPSAICLLKPTIPQRNGLIALRNGSATYGGGFKLFWPGSRLAATSHSARASSPPLYGGEASGIGRQPAPAPPALRRRGAISSVFEVGTQLSTAAETVHSPATLDNGRHGGNRCVMVAFAVSRLASRHEIVARALSDKIADYRASEGDTVSLRLREPLQQKIGQLIDFEHDPDFPALPEEEQSYVQQRLGELEAYRAFWDKIQGVSLDEIRSQADADRLIRRLAGGDLDTPAPHQSDWEETQAGLRHGHLLKNLYALRGAA